MKHYLFGIKITMLYLIGYIFYNKRLQQKYGNLLFHWTMPYSEGEGFVISIKLIPNIIKTIYLYETTHNTRTT